MNESSQFNEALTLALRLSLKERIQLVARLASSLERELESLLPDEAPMTEHAHEKKVPMQPAPIKPTIAFDVLDQIDVRVGTIERVEDVDGSDKLMRLIVSFGDHSRTILAGIKKERADPREIEGKQALFVVNLAPRKMMGELSEGMLFDIGYADGVTPALAVPEHPVPDGTRAG